MITKKFKYKRAKETKEEGIARMSNKRRNDIDEKESKIRELEQEVRRLKRQLREHTTDMLNTSKEKGNGTPRGPRSCRVCGKGPIVETTIDLPHITLCYMTCDECGDTETSKVRKGQSNVDSKESQ